MRKKRTLNVARTVWSRKTLVRVFTIERDSSAPAPLDFFSDIDLEVRFLEGKADSSKDCLIMILSETFQGSLRRMGGTHKKKLGGALNAVYNTK